LAIDGIEPLRVIHEMLILQILLVDTFQFVACFLPQGMPQTEKHLQITQNCDEYMNKIFYRKMDEFSVFLR
jgi:hypothetical protein